MSQIRIAVNVLKVKFEYNRSRPNEVYDAIKQFYPDLTAKDFTAELIEKFIPEGACSVTWTKNLRNVEYNRSKPKTPRRSYRSKGNRKHSPAKRIAKATTFNALMEVA